MPLNINEKSHVKLSERDLVDATVTGKNIQIQSSENGYYSLSGCQIESTTGKIQFNGLSITTPLFKHYLKELGVTVIVENDTRKITLKAEKQNVILTDQEIAWLASVAPQSERRRQQWNISNEDFIGSFSHRKSSESLVCLHNTTCFLQTELNLTFLLADFTNTLFRINGPFTMNNCDVSQPAFIEFLRQKGFTCTVVTTTQEGLENKLLILASASKPSKISLFETAKFNPAEPPCIPHLGKADPNLLSDSERRDLNSYFTTSEDYLLTSMPKKIEETFKKMFPKGTFIDAEDVAANTSYDDLLDASPTLLNAAPLSRSSTSSQTSKRKQECENLTSDEKAEETASVDAEISYSTRVRKKSKH